MKTVNRYITLAGLLLTVLAATAQQTYTLKVKNMPEDLAALMELSYWGDVGTNHYYTYQLTEGIQVEAGQTVTLNTYDSRYYTKFLKWTVDGTDTKDAVNSEGIRTLSLTMPAHDVEVEVWMKYRPDSPSEPEAAPAARTLKVVSQAGYNLAIEMGKITNSRYEWWKGFVWEMPNPRGQYYLPYYYPTVGVLPGDTVAVYVKPDNYGWRFSHLEMDGKRVFEGAMTSNYPLENSHLFTMKMPDHDVTIYAYGSYDPDAPDMQFNSGSGLGNYETPGNPGTNTWNAATGELFINNLVKKRGTSYNASLGGAIAEMMDEYGFQQSDVKQLTLVGDISSGTSFGYNSELTYLTEQLKSTSNLTAMETLDLSNTKNLSQLPEGLTFNDGTAVTSNMLKNLGVSETNRIKHLILPACLRGLYGSWINDPSTNKSVRRGVFFRPLTALEDLTLYAVAPPKVEEGTISYLPEGVVLYVPEQSVAAYKADTAWCRVKDIRPIPVPYANDVTVALPADWTDGRYQGMSLCLINTLTDDVRRYVIDERSAYLFRSLAQGSALVAQLRTVKDDIIAETDTMAVGDGQLDMEFKRLRLLHDLQLKVQTPSENDITNLVEVTWTDSKGSRLSFTPQLQKQIDGTFVYYTLKLPKQLAGYYVQPPTTEVIVGLGSDDITVTLALMDSVTVSGTIRDTAGNRIGGANVTVSQLLNGVVGKTFTTTADANGRYELKALAGQAAVSAAATGYAPQRQELTLTALQTQTADLQLPALEGAVVKFSLSYTPSVAEGETAEEQPCYTDFRNVAISAYNETTGHSLDSLSVQHPEIIILDGAKTGDRIRLTATSLTGAFAPAIATATLDSEKRDSVGFHLVERGGMLVSFAQTDNKAVSASLYDAEGHLYDIYPFAEASQTITGLDEGKYTLITMATSSLYGKLEQLSQYEAVGLQAGHDYVKNEVTVKPGIYTNVHNETIPVFDKSAYYYTQSDSTTLNMNKTEVTIGQNVTLRAQVCFKPEYRDLVSKVQLLIDLSPNAIPVEGACMTGNHIVTTSTEGNGRIVIPVALDDLDKMTRLVVTAINNGSLLSTAYVRFNLGDKQLTQPIGTFSCAIKNGIFNVPQYTNNLEINVKGSTTANSTVTLFAFGNEFAQTETDSNGDWNVYCQLPELPNCINVPIYAQIRTGQGLEFQTETKNMYYDRDLIVVEDVYMYYAEARYKGHPYWGNGFNDAKYIHFDFRDPSTLEDQYFITRSHGTDHYTYKIFLNTTDTTKVADVELGVKWMDGSIDYYGARFNDSEKCWIANVEGFYTNPPVNIDVNIIRTSKYQKVLDGDVIQLMYNPLNSIQDGIRASESELHDKIAAIGLESNRTKQAAMLRELLVSEGYDPDATLDAEWNDLTAEQCQAKAEEVLSSIELSSECLLNADPFSIDPSSGLSFSHTAGLSRDQLLSEGYEEILTTTGSLYQFADEEKFVLVDLQNDIQISIATDDLAEVSSARWRAPIPESAMNKWMSTQGSLNNEMAKLQAKADAVQTGCTFLLEALNLEKGISRLSNSVTALNNTMMKYGANEGTLKAMEAVMKKRDFLQHLQQWLNHLQKDGPDVSSCIAAFSKAEGAIAKAVKGALKTLKACEKFFAWTTIIADGYESITTIGGILKRWQKAPLPCKDEPQRAQALNDDIAWQFGGALFYYPAAITSDVTSLAATYGGLVGAPESAGISLAISVLGVGATCLKVWLAEQYSEMIQNKFKYWDFEIDDIKCNKEKEEDNETRKERIRREHNPNYEFKPASFNTFPDMKTGIDPSGYVYEAVADNRVEGATATIYYRQTGEDEWGDQHDEAVKWNAAEMGQENPLLTDAEGKYAWDVPKGLWQVKIEKDGYLPATSEWLPVPPPQLDINIGLVQNALPQVASASAYEDAIEVEFNKYMRPHTLTSDNIWMVKDGRKLPARIVMENQSQAYNSDSAYVSRIQIWPEDGTEMSVGETISLAITHQVESYAGLQMQEDFLQEFTVKRAIRELSVDTLIEVPLDGERTFTVLARPAAAAAGQRLTTAVTISSLATIEGEPTFDDNGMARLTVKGLQGGYTQLALVAEGSRASAQTMIQVMDPSLIPTATPSASRISGTYVGEGDTVELFCDTEGATIWYTLDSSCPCDENGPRQVYTGPIKLSGDGSVTLKAYAVKEEQQESRVASYTYYFMPEVMADANGDGKLNIADIVEAINYMNGKPSKRFNKAAADANNDSKVNIGDILRMVNAIMQGKRTK